MAISKASAQEQARIADEKDRAERVAKARAIAKGEAPQPDQSLGLVRVRVLPMGDGKISMGQHIGGIGEAYYAHEDEIEQVPLDTAEALVARGFVEIMKPKRAKAEVQTEATEGEGA